ncbi:MAG: hypothetical protein RMX89_02270, partial [Nostoc sp. DedSLP04]|nr:hypothetical protein [Nostoc sp. DedSLP04]
FEVLESRFEVLESRFEVLPNKKTYNYFLWGGHLVRPKPWAGETPTPQDWIIYFLVIPKTGFQSLSPLRGEVWRGVKTMLQNDKSRLMYFSFFV